VFFTQVAEEVGKMLRQVILTLLHKEAKEAEGEPGMTGVIKHRMTE
jgi:hypothetical protein